MDSIKNGAGYNERLFQSGLRRFMHLARFKWCREAVISLNCPLLSVLELGCFDGKMLNFLPTRPARYVGFDADWEGGLALASARWAGEPGISFFKATTPGDISLTEGDKFDLVIALETLEHVPPHLVDGYLEKLWQHCGGYLLVTAPNEKGPVFLAKYLLQKILGGDAEHYSWAEVINATAGRLDRVARGEHKGFDYSVLISQIDRYFEVIDVSGHPISFLPKSMSFGIGIIGKPRPARQEG